MQNNHDFCSSFFRLDHRQTLEHFQQINSATGKVLVAEFNPSKSHLSVKFNKIFNASLESTKNIIAESKLDEYFNATIAKREG